MELDQKWKKSRDQLYSFLQDMLIVVIAVEETKILRQFNNKLESLELSAIKSIDVELQNCIYKFYQLSRQEIDKKVRDFFILQADSIMDRLSFMHHQVIALTPDFDGEKITPNTSLKIILSKDRDQNEFGCPECKQSFINQMRMQRHFNSKHRYEYPCSICSSRFEDEMNAHVHEKVIHLKIYKDNTCTYCKSRLSDTKVLRKHLISQHGKLLRKDFINKFRRSPKRPYVDEEVVPTDPFYALSLQYMKQKAQQSISSRKYVDINEL